MNGSPTGPGTDEEVVEREQLAAAGYLNTAAKLLDAAARALTRSSAHADRLVRGPHDYSNCVPDFRESTMQDIAKFAITVAERGSEVAAWSQSVKGCRR